MDQREEDRRHETRLSENIHNLNRRKAYDVFDSHTQLAHEAAGRFATRHEREIDLIPVSGRYAEWPVLNRPQMAGFELSTEGLQRSA
jgi:hypothetical protein